MSQPHSHLQFQGPPVEVRRGSLIENVRKSEKVEADKKTILAAVLSFFETRNIEKFRKVVEHYIPQYTHAPLTCRLDAAFDVARLKDDLEKIESSASPWINRNALGTWKIIHLRSPFGDPQLDSYRHDISEYRDTPLLKQSPYFQEVLRYFQCPTYRVRLAKLEQGGKLLPHADPVFLRFHIPIVTHKDVRFYLSDEQIVMREGELWFLDTSFVHSVENRSPVDRVHLLIDVAYTPWVKSIFPRNIPIEIVTTQWFRNAQNLRAMRHLIAPKESLDKIIGPIRDHLDYLM